MWKDDVVTYTSIDPRGAAFFRIVMGICILVESGDRYWNAFDRFVDGRQLPRARVLNYYATNLDVNSMNQLNVFYAGGSPMAIRLIFSLYLSSTCAYIVGYRTTLSGFISSLLTVHMNARLVGYNYGRTRSRTDPPTSPPHPLDALPSSILAS